MTIKYRLGKILGEGASGVVRELKTTDGTETELVVKVVDEALEFRIRKEHRFYSLLDGVSCVPKVRHFGKMGHNGRYAMAMDNAGESLGDYVRTGLLAQGGSMVDREEHQTTIACIASELVYALGKIHSKGVVHGDIHPDNIMIQWPLGVKTPVVRFIDFETSKLVDGPLDMGGETTFNYMFASAERISDPPQGPSIADDLIALGYTIIHLTTCGLPWDDDMIPDSGSISNLDELVDMKRVCSASVLCADLPPVYRKFISFVLRLKSSVRPPRAEYIRHSAAFRVFAQGSPSGSVKSPSDEVTCIN